MFAFVCFEMTNTDRIHSERLVLDGTDCCLRSLIYSARRLHLNRADILSVSSEPIQIDDVYTSTKHDKGVHRNAKSSTPKDPEQ